MNTLGADASVNYLSNSRFVKKKSSEKINAHMESACDRCLVHRKRNDIEKYRRVDLRIFYYFHASKPSVFLSCYTYDIVIYTLTRIQKPITERNP